MAVWIDMIGSFLIGSLLVLNLLRIDVGLKDHVGQNAQHFIAQGQAISVAALFEADVRKAGYGVSGVALITADSSAVRFLADLDASGAVDTLHYYVGSTATAAHTSNPSDRALYRAHSGAPLQTLQAGITDFRLSYFDAQGDSLTFPVALPAVHQIRLDLMVESQEPCGGTYATVFARVSVRPKNL